MNNLIIIGHPDQNSFCHSGIFKTIVNTYKEYPNQNIKTIDLDSEYLAKKLIEYKVPKREIAKIISSVTKQKVNRVYDLIKNL